MIDSYQRYATGLFVLSFVCLFICSVTHVTMDTPFIVRPGSIPAWILFFVNI